MATKTKGDEDVRYKTIDELMAGINKKHGPGAMVLGSQITKLPYLSTGSLSLDIMLGGGWMVNKFHEIIGEFSSGKSALCLQTLADAHEKDPEFECLWIAGEPYDAEWAAQNGVDNDRVYVYETNIMEAAYGLVEEAMKNRAVDLIVIDSLPSLIPTIEDEKEMEDLTVGRGALVNNKFFVRKGTAALRRRFDKPDRACTVLCINQWREKIGVMHGDPRTTPGGKGKDFAFCTRVETRRSGWIDVAKPGDGKETIGIEISMRTVKNKAAPNHRAATVDFYFDGVMAGSWDRAKDMANTAIYMGVVRKGGGWLYFGDDKWNGLDKFSAALREDLDLQREIRETTLKVLGNKSTDPRVSDDEASDD